MTWKNEKVLNCKPLIPLGAGAFDRTIVSHAQGKLIADGLERRIVIKGLSRTNANQTRLRSYAGLTECR